MYFSREFCFDVDKNAQSGYNTNQLTEWIWAIEKYSIKEDEIWSVKFPNDRKIYEIIRRVQKTNVRFVQTPIPSAVLVFLLLK